MRQTFSSSLPQKSRPSLVHETLAMPPFRNIRAENSMTVELTPNTPGRFNTRFSLLASPMDGPGQTAFLQPGRSAPGSAPLWQMTSVGPGLSGHWKESGWGGKEKRKRKKKYVISSLCTSSLVLVKRF